MSRLTRLVQRFEASKAQRWQPEAPTPLPAVAAPFSPKDISDLQIWLESDWGLYKDAGLTLPADNDSVQECHDQSGNGNHATQTTGAARPLYKTGIINGRPVIRFQGTDDQLALADAAIPLAAGTFVVVGNLASTSQGGVIERYSGGLGIRLAMVSGTLYMSTDGTQSSAALTGSAFHVYLATWAGTTAKVDRDGTNIISFTSVTPSAPVGGSTRIGNSSDQGFLVFDAALILVYNRALSATEQARLNRWAGQKYNIAVA